MALSDEVIARYGDQYLVNLTNPYLSGPTTVDTTRLTKACDDVEADFEIHAGIEYDGTENIHVSVAVDGVIAKLEVRCGIEDAEKNLKDWRENRLKSGLALVTSRDRVGPLTSSQLDQSDETRGRDITRPDFDRSRFKHIVPDAPQTAEDAERYQ